MSSHAAILRTLRLIAFFALLLGGVAPPVAAQTDLDALMDRVLKNRDQSWRQLQEYLLDERERFELVGPDRTRLWGMEREFLWVARQGVAVRSPVRFNGVALSEDERARYEKEWIEDEGRLTIRAGPLVAERRPEGERASPDAPAGEAAGATIPDPRFISEASFLRFRFEPGNYYLAGRETLAGTDVLRIEYYPTRMFSGDAKDPARERDEVEDRIEAAMNKVTLVTLWVDPVQHQIVRFTFDNVDFNFLPGRSIARVDAAQATMTMGQPFAGIWLPTNVTVEGAITLANGSYRATYRREFHDYRRGDVQVRFRVKDD